MRSCSTALLLALGASVTHAYECDLVIADFINRANGNDGIAVANPCTTAINGNNYYLEFYIDSLYTPSRTFELATLGSIPAREVRTVFSHQTGHGDDFTPDHEFPMPPPVTVIVFRGTEAIILKNKDGVTIDTLGQIGANADWGVGRRITRSTSELAHPDRNPYDAFVLPSPAWTNIAAPAGAYSIANPHFTAGSKYDGEFYLKWPQGKCVDDQLAGEQIDTPVKYANKALCCAERCKSYPADSVCHNRCLDKPSDAAYDNGQGRCLEGTSNPPVAVFPQCLLTVTGASAGIMPLFQASSLPLVGHHRVACCQEYLPSQDDYNTCMSKTGSWFFVKGRGCVLHDGITIDAQTTVPRLAATARACGSLYFDNQAKFCDDTDVAMALTCPAGTEVNAGVHCGTHVDDCTVTRCCHRKCTTPTAYGCPPTMTLRVPAGDCGLSFEGCNDNVCCVLTP
eukprot:Rhum_TRINITY_DN22821_c0_g1::Rhum_TRINITY_DN22821_c0_g1_i1::g.176229::m.176229